jgi:trehalose 6-phosphate synthase/phosphatase
VLKLLRHYEDSTPGSVIEEKTTSLVWHYRRADPEFGRWKANELATELEALTANEPVVVRHGKKIIEITAAAVNKGAAVRRLLADEPPHASCSSPATTRPTRACSASTCRIC